MKHNLVSGAASFCGGFHGVAQMGKNGEGERIGQGKQLARGGEALPEIVNNDGGVKDAADLPQLPSGHRLPVTKQADISDSPSCLGPGFI
jgi:hypothetical protein